MRAASRSALFATFFICGASTNGLIQTHFIPLCADFGLPAVGAASVLAMMGIFDFFGTIRSRTATTTAGSSPGTTDCAASR